MSQPRERTLGALHSLRELDEARAQAHHAAAARTAERRREELTRHESALRSHQARTQAALSHVGEGEEAAALQQRALYRRGRALAEAPLRAAVRAARSALQEAEAHEAEARARLGTSHAQRRAVERERDRQVQKNVARRTRD